MCLDLSAVIGVAAAEVTGAALGVGVVGMALAVVVVAVVVVAVAVVMNTLQQWNFHSQLDETTYC